MPRLQMASQCVPLFPGKESTEGKQDVTRVVAGCFSKPFASKNKAPKRGSQLQPELLQRRDRALSWVNSELVNAGRAHAIAAGGASSWWLVMPKRLARVLDPGHLRRWLVGQKRAGHRAGLDRLFLLVGIELVEPGDVIEPSSAGGTSSTGSSCFLPARGSW